MTERRVLTIKFSLSSAKSFFMDYDKGDRVDLIIIRATPLGYLVEIDGHTEGLLYKSEVFQKIDQGDQLKGYIKQIRGDGKIDLSLKPQGFRNAIDLDCDVLLSHLKNQVFLRLTDKSSSEDIRAQLQMSKKAFKKAVGFLYKRKVILIEDDGIRLIGKK